METPPSPPKQPDPKKLKMSTTTTDDDDDDRAATERKQRYKRRKIAIFFAYCGVGYQGMQKNPGAKTIEGDLEEALYLSGAVPEQDRGIPKRFDWARSARTDKGVSAVGQVVSGRFYIDPPGLVDRLHSKLPPQIRIFGYKRVTASFNAKKFCDRRRYVYLIPVFALDPCCHRDRESVLASLGSGSELVKCLECSERGRKVAGVMGKRIFEPNGDLSEVMNHSDLSSNNGAAVSYSEVEKTTGVPLDEANCSKSNTDDSTSNKGAVLKPEMSLEDKKIEGDVDMSVNGEEQPVKESGFTVEHSADMQFQALADTGISSNDGTAVSETEVKEATGVFSEITDYKNLNAGDSMDCDAADKKGVVLTPELGVEEKRIEAGLDMSGNRAENVVSGTELGISSNDGTAVLETEVKEATGVSLEITDHENLNAGDSVNCGAAGDKGVVLTPELGVEEKRIEGDLDMSSNGAKKVLNGNEFCYSEEVKERFNRILKQYEGTHNFHNFTTRTKAEDPSAKRYIVSFDAKTVVTVQGMDFVKCEVVGQSFMLHQIRKMVGLAVAIMRNCAPESLIETALQQDVNINVPTAPEVGLYLDECFFASYNQKWKDHEELSMKAYAEEAEKFKMNPIYTHIASTEHKEGAVGLWLHSLNHRNYPDLGFVSNGGASEPKNGDADVLPEATVS